MYGISKFDREFLKLKLKNQRNFLENNYINLGTESLPYSKFYFSSWHNPQRYIAELNNRVSSLNEYAVKNNLKPIFAVFTLPSEYHRRRFINRKNGKFKSVRNDKFVNDELHSVKSGSEILQKIVRSVLNSNTFRQIPKEKRCYITTKEPHIDGTPHLNFLCFVPAEFLDRCVKVIKRRFISEQNNIQIDINNPTAYIMKYIFKTLDDLRNSDDIENLGDITFWYLKHKIRRFTMSHTFVSLEIYRKLSGRIDLISFTKNYNKGLITALIDTKGKVIQIFDEFGDLWSKIKYHNNFINTKKRINKLIKTPQPQINYCNSYDLRYKPFKKMNCYEIMTYYKLYDHSCEEPERMAFLENELISRNLGDLVKKVEPWDLNELYNENYLNEVKDDFDDRNVDYARF